MQALITIKFSQHVAKTLRIIILKQEMAILEKH